MLIEHSLFIDPDFRNYKPEIQLAILKILGMSSTNGHIKNFSGASNLLEISDDILNFLKKHGYIRIENNQLDVLKWGVKLKKKNTPIQQTLF